MSNAQKCLDQLAQCIAEKKTAKETAIHVRDLRKALEMTLTGFAVALDVSIATVYRWEHAKCIPRWRILQSMAAIMHHDITKSRNGSPSLIDLQIQIATAQDAINLLSVLRKSIESHPSHPQIINLKVD